MRSPISSRVLKVHVAALVAVALIIGSAATVAAKPPPKPPPTPSPTPTLPPQPPPAPTITIASTGTLEPDQVYANIDVTVTCAAGSTFKSGWIYILQNDRGGSGTFTSTCTGTPQVARSRVVNGNRFTLGQLGPQGPMCESRRTASRPRSRPRRRSRSCPPSPCRSRTRASSPAHPAAAPRSRSRSPARCGATGQSSSVTVSQGTASGSASFTPICDRQTRTVVLSLTASGAAFHTGSANASVSASVGFNGGSFSGTDSRAVTLLESSAGDTTPPTTPGEPQRERHGGR